MIARYGGYKVRLVDAEAIRDSSLENEAFTDFAIHHDLPGLVPPKEIWVANDGMSYDDAHEDASKIEFECRERRVAPPVELLDHRWVDERLAQIQASSA